MTLWCIRFVCQMDACLGMILWGSEQIQFARPFDCRTAIRDIEFAVDALGMSADCTQGDDELSGDFRAGEFGSEQAEHIKLTLSKRRGQGLRSVRCGGGGCFARAPLRGMALMMLSAKRL